MPAKLKAAEAARDTFRALQRSLNAEIPPGLAENDGWPQAAMPSMLAELGLTEAPEVGWFVSAASPLYDAAPPDGWRRYSHRGDGPDLWGMAYAGPPARVYLRADLNLPDTLRVLGHEVYHLREFVRGEPLDEQAADEFGVQAAARFWASTYQG